MLLYTLIIFTSRLQTQKFFKQQRHTFRARKSKTRQNGGGDKSGFQGHTGQSFRIRLQTACFEPQSTLKFTSSVREVWWAAQRVRASGCTYSFSVSKPCSLYSSSCLMQARSLFSLLTWTKEISSDIKGAWIKQNQTHNPALILFQ